MSVTEKLSAIQQAIKVPKKRHNDFGDYNYRSVEDILGAFKRLEDAYKVTIIMADEIVNIGPSNYIRATATLYDLETAETISAVAYAKEPDQPKAKMDHSQTTGSASSYARKYALNGLLLLDDAVDPDSNRAIDTGEPANEAQVKTIETIAGSHNVNLPELYKRYKVKGGRPTAYQAGLILNVFKKNFGDE